jgi:hypothetical protein
VDVIVAAVISFLDIYNTSQKIIDSKSDFTEKLSTLIGTLNVRIEFEEEGVFGFYLLM